MSTNLSDDTLLHILYASPNATAIYATPDIIIQMANEAMLVIWGKDKSVIGMPFAEALPEVAEQPFLELLKEVWNSGITYQAKATGATLNLNNQPATHYFDFEYKAIKNNEGQVYGILHTANDVTERVLQTKALILLQSKQHDLDKELAAAIEAYNRLELINKNYLAGNQPLRHAILKVPVALGILSGPQLTIESANEDLLQVWGRPANVIGKPLIEALPELEDQPFPAILQQVLATGQPYYGNEEKALLEYECQLQERYFNYIYQPLKDDAGKVTSIMIVSNDVTEQVVFNTNIQQLNEKLSAANEELNTANKQLTESNENFKDAHAHLQLLYHKLEESDSWFRIVIEQAPVAIAIFRGAEMTINAANPLMQDLLAKDETIIGKPLLTAIPELAGQPPYELLNHVFTTGQPQFGYEQPVMLHRNGTMETGYFNFSYVPLIENGAVAGVVDIAIELTGQVKAHQAVQRLNGTLTATNEELLAANGRLASVQHNLNKLVFQLAESEFKLRQAIASGNMGTWSVDAVTQHITMSPRSRRLFGFSTRENIVVDDIIAVIEPEYQTVLTKTLMNAIQHLSELDTTYPIKQKVTHERRWVRATGKAYTNEDGQKTSYSGMLMDVTEQKEDEQRKSDFINMVSHELKTPLTSTKAYIQLLFNKAQKNGDILTGNILGKVDKQMNKMTTMINGFLNVSRLESGKIYIHNERCNMAEIIKEAEEEAVPVNTLHTLVFDLVEPIFVAADKDKIGHVIHNFISNAVKYSKPGTTIHIACVLVEGNVQVSVKDNGMGVAPEDATKLFERYYRVEGSEMKAITGFGIGLYLCKEIIDRHSGQIGVISELGKGSTFWFTLPLA